LKSLLKKITAVILTAVFLLLPLNGGAFAVTPAEAAQLKFGADKKFTIMQVADIQDGPGLLPATARFLKKAVEEANPDLIVLTGDNIMGGKSRSDAATANAIDKFMSIFEEAGVPVAAVFGNHDDEGNTSKEKQMAMYMSYNCFIGYDEGEDLSGVGTYNIPIYSSSNPQKAAFNIWMIDSGTYDTVNGGYAHVQQDQIDWYVNKSNQLKADNGGTPVPSLMFQHIAVPEVYDAFVSVPLGTPGSIFKYGKCFVLNPEMTKAGELNEAPCPPDINGGQFEAVRNQGDVLAIAFGHDHLNTYEVTVQDVDLICTPTAGLASYGDNNRGVRVFTLDENDTESYSTYLYQYTDCIDPDSVFSIGYVIVDRFWQFALPFMQFFLIISELFS